MDDEDAAGNDKEGRITCAASRETGNLGSRFSWDLFTSLSRRFVRKLLLHCIMFQPTTLHSIRQFFIILHYMHYISAKQIQYVF